MKSERTERRAQEEERADEWNPNPLDDPREERRDDDDDADQRYGSDEFFHAGMSPWRELRATKKKATKAVSRQLPMRQLSFRTQTNFHHGLDRDTRPQRGYRRPQRGAQK